MENCPCLKKRVNGIEKKKGMQVVGDEEEEKQKGNERVGEEEEEQQEDEDDVQWSFLVF